MDERKRMRKKERERENVKIKKSLRNNTFDKHKKQTGRTS